MGFFVVQTKRSLRRYLGEGGATGEREVAKCWKVVSRDFSLMEGKGCEQFWNNIPIGVKRSKDNEPWRAQYASNGCFSGKRRNA